MKKIIKNINRVTSRLNHDFKFYHLFSLKEPSVNQFDFKKNLKDKISNNFINRISSYAKYLQENEPIIKNDDLWNMLGNEMNHQKFINFVSGCKNYKDKFIETIYNFGKTNVLHGFAPNRGIYHGLVKKKTVREKEKIYFLDNLISLCEYYGITKVYNPEQGGWMVEEADFNSFIKIIFQKKNISIFKTPNHYYGYKFNRDFLFYKDLKGLYAAEKISSACKNHNLSEIVEIGGGIGYTCHYSRQLINNNYTIYDLSYASLLQAIFLMMSSGEKNVHLCNEKVHNKNKIFIKPYWKIFEHKTKKNILWFNEDSLPEIDLSLSKKYIKKITKIKKSFLLSVNQEARNSYGTEIKQHTVYDLLNNHKKIYRTRDFLRPGYIEELIEI